MSKSGSLFQILQAVLLLDLHRSSWSRCSHLPLIAICQISRIKCDWHRLTCCYIPMCMLIKCERWIETFSNDFVIRTHLIGYECLSLPCVSCDNKRPITDPETVALCAGQCGDRTEMPTAAECCCSIESPPIYKDVVSRRYCQRFDWCGHHGHSNSLSHRCIIRERERERDLHQPSNTNRIRDHQASLMLLWKNNRCQMKNNLTKGYHES